jgi:uncharacterized membrane protein
MNSRIALALCVLVMLAVSSYAVYSYRLLPETIPIHWNASGTIDGYGSRSTILMWPFLALLPVIFLVALPWLSPKNFTIDSFRATFNNIMVVVSVMMGYLSAVIIYTTLNPQWDMIKPMFAGIMLFTGLMGNLMGKVQRNFFVGIRTPWTLASDKVWVATHRLGARLMFGAGILGALLVIAGAPPVPVLVAFMIAILYPVLYSLLLYKKLERTRTI